MFANFSYLVTCILRLKDTLHTFDIVPYGATTLNAIPYLFDCFWPGLHIEHIGLYTYEDMKYVWDVWYDNKIHKIWKDIWKIGNPNFLFHI